MKKYIIYIASFILLIAGQSCSDDLLDKNPPLDPTGSTIFASHQKIEENLLGIYGNAKKIIALRNHVYVEARGDDFINLSVNNQEGAFSYQMSVGLDDLDNTDTWTGIYAAINNANTFLEKLANSKSVAGADYDKYVAEAKFVRALCYYYLNQLYAQPYLLDSNAKSVPLRLKAENSTKNNNQARATVTEVYNQILDDLSDANLNALPDNQKDYDSVTRATKDAVRMLRMRCYMEQGLWQKAIIEGEAITGYTLPSDIATVFSTPYISDESIFSFPMAETNRGERQTAFAYYLYDGSRFIIDVNGGVYSKPNYSLTSDQRVSKLLGKVGTQTISKKFPDSQNYLDWIPVFRFAETKLNLSECYYRVARNSDAKTVLKEVRNRSIDPLVDPLDIDGLSGTDLFEAIDNERRTEFIGEAIRSFDIHRRGETFYKQKGTQKAITVSPTANGYVWPIPTIERVVNDLIED